MSRSRSSRRISMWQQLVSDSPEVERTPKALRRRRNLRYCVRILVAILLCAPLLLAGCSDSGSPGDATETVPLTKDDPAITAALGGKLMIDPDLVSQNEGGSALTAATAASMPLTNMTQDAAGAARSDAASKAGGSSMSEPPTATELKGDSFRLASLTASARASAFPGAQSCASALRYSAAWAARLPDAFPVYPRGATQEAAGSDSSGCALRVVKFTTPVSPNDVLAFYNARAKKAGYTVKHQVKGGESILTGTKGNASYGVFVREIGEDASAVDLVTIGGVK